MPTTAPPAAEPRPARRARDLPAYRVYAAIFAVCLWAVAFYALATPGRLDRYGQLKGTDFAAFVVQGSFVVPGPIDRMYDIAAWKARLQALAPELPDLLYIPVYPPQVGLLFAPLAAIPYFPALLIWSVISAGLCLVALRLAIAAAPELSSRYWDGALVIAAAPAFNQLLLHGQIASLVAVCLAGGLAAFARGRDLAAGLWLGSLAFKPHYAALAALIFVSGREWKVAGWIAVAAAAQMAATFLWTGPDVFLAFVQSIAANVDRAYLFEPRPWTQHGLRSALVLLLGQGRPAEVLYATLAIAAVALTAWRWRAIGDRRLQAALVGTLVVLLNPHVFAYELVVLLPSLVLLAGFIGSRRREPDAILLERLIVAVLVLPLMGPLAAFTRVQLSVAAIGALAFTVWRTSVSARPTDRP